jgi:hypothetical protein
MAINGITRRDLQRMIEPLNQVREDPSLLAENRANVDEKRFAVIDDIVRRTAAVANPTMKRFWAKVHNDYELLAGLARVMWHTGGWEKQPQNIVRLLAVQRGDARTAAAAMRFGGTYFSRTLKPRDQAIAVVHGPRWDVPQADTRNSIYNVDAGRKALPPVVPIEIAVQVYENKRGSSIIGALLSIRPHAWMENLHTLKDALLSVRYDGRPLTNEKKFGWLSIPGSEKQFKGTSFIAQLPLTPLRSSCLSIAILKQGVRTLFIHPIGLGK